MIRLSCGRIAVLLGLVTLLAGWGCAPESVRDAGLPTALAPAEVKPLFAVANIEARTGSTVSGTATFVEADGKVRVVILVKGAAPGQHAVHVHEKGDCSDPEAKSAGSHFNPDGPSHKHGAPSDLEHHAGDFGNMEVDANGIGKLELETAGLTVKPGPRSVVGRAIIIHDKADDFVTQPTGNAGGRIGCGVILVP